MRKEPALIAAGLAQLISLIVPALVLFNLINWTPEQIAGFMAIISFAATFVATLYTRQSVTPVDKANEQIQAGINSPKGTTVQEVIEKVEEKRNEI